MARSSVAARASGLRVVHDFSDDRCSSDDRFARSPACGVEHTETVRVAGHCSHLRVTCRSGHLHAHWRCDCGATGISSPYASLDSAVQAAHAAVRRHHVRRHAPARTLASA